jgi:aryl-alcohol dehydrogenase-like predicted oxidoreductase
VKSCPDSFLLALWSNSKAAPKAPSGAKEPDPRGREQGRSTAEVPALSPGTCQVLDARGREQEEVRYEVARAALEEGTSLFDSSPMCGEAEQVLGDALRQHGRGEAVAAEV